VLDDLARGVPVPQDVRGEYYRYGLRAVPPYRCRGVFRGDVTFFEADQAQERTPPYEYVDGTVMVVPISGRRRDLVNAEQMHAIGRAIQCRLS